MIYIDEHINDFDLQEALAAVSPQRREYALRYWQERDQRLSVAAYRLLQQALLQEYGIKELPQFDLDTKGKPMLQGHTDIHFSLSHCDGAAACAVSDSPVGIDIEALDHYSEQAATAVMNADEMRQILDSANPAAAFTRLWTMKESYFKLTGNDHNGNIPHMLDNASDFIFTTVNHHPRFICTTCQRKD